MSIKLEVGKYYITRDGNAVFQVKEIDERLKQPIRALCHSAKSCSVFEHNIGDPIYFYEDGKYLFYGDKESGCDLVASFNNLNPAPEGQ